MLLSIRILWFVLASIVHDHHSHGPGNTTDYCGSGCQSTYGICSGSDSVSSEPDMCGPANGNNKCLSGLCCSTAGYTISPSLSTTNTDLPSYCGNTTDYCSAGCQSDYGDCTSNIGGNEAGTCGPAFGNAQCSIGLCCSAAVRLYSRFSEQEP